MGTIRNKLLAVIAAGALSVTALASITPFTENPTDLPQANASGSLKSTTEGCGRGGRAAGKKENSESMRRQNPGHYLCGEVFLRSPCLSP